jgi:hypothetical protein
MVDTAPGIDRGMLYPQTGSSFTDASLSGTFTTGLAEVISQDIGDLSVGTITLDGSGHISGTRDLMSTSTQSLDHNFTDTYAVNSNGTFSLGSTGAAIVGLIISSSQFGMFDSSSITTSIPTILIGSK